MARGEFFADQGEQSAVKARIVSKYFDAWSRIIVGPAERAKKGIAYVDLFAGPGRYQSGAISTPLLVLQTAIANPQLSNALVSLFNDRDGDLATALKQEIANLPNIERLKHQPLISADDIDAAAAEYFQTRRLIPTLSFIDPFGYKGLSLGLVRAMTKDWGSDCVFFFNYRRINSALSTSLFSTHMQALFGAERASRLTASLSGVTAYGREKIIMAALREALKEAGARYVVAFRFRDRRGRTTHHLVFVTKGEKGYTVMKDIMAGESSHHDEGVPSMEYCPVGRLPLSFEPIAELGEQVCKHFAGRQVTMKGVYLEHSGDKDFISRNYKAALIRLKDAGRIETIPTKLRKNSFADDVVAVFPT